MSLHAELIENVLRMECEAIEEAGRNMDMQVLDDIIEQISSHEGKIVLSGSGTSGAAARKIAHALNCIERPAVYLDPSEALHGGLGIVQDGDIVFLFSKGGETEEINRMIPVCKMKKTNLIAVTENMESPLAAQADSVLRIRVERESDPLNVFATSSIIATLAVFDAICICVARQTKYTKERFALIHPGGAVGKRLQNELGEKKR